MRIAILGAGFAGLATAWHLLTLSQASCKVDIFDPMPLGKNASGISSGLLHPFTGKRAQLTSDGERLMNQAHALLTASAAALNRPLILSNGIVRPAQLEQQIQDFQKTAEAHKECQWLTVDQAEQKVAGLHFQNRDGGALFIKNGVTIDVGSYLDGLLQASIRLGAQHFAETITEEERLLEYDRVLLSVGGHLSRFEAFKGLPFTAIKGQVLEFEWPQHLPPLAHSVVGDAHLVMRPGGKTCLVGATFERKFEDLKPDAELAGKALLPKILSFFPQLEGAKLIDCRAAVRACSKTRLPLIYHTAEKFWVFSGLGAKGLLYHGATARRLAKAMLENDTGFIPPELLFKQKL